MCTLIRGFLGVRLLVFASVAQSGSFKPKMLADTKPDPDVAGEVGVVHDRLSRMYTKQIVVLGGLPSEVTA
nr:hypothetical protein [Thioalkalivibrio sp.]